jgi:NAD(P)-dependent dehydrogenase (short-subunit alcohol dehydrogenase family)/acyl carrier protein
MTVIPQENPHCDFRLIDLGESLHDEQLNSRQAETSSHLFRVFTAVSKELFDNVHSEKIVALRAIERKSTNIQRFVPRYQQIYLNESHEKRGKELLIPLNNTTKRVFLITGGLGRIGMTICSMLGNLSQQNNRTKVRIVLTTRNDFPNKNDWHKIINENNINQSISKKVKDCIRQLIQLENRNNSLEIVIKKLNFYHYQDTQAFIHECFFENTGGIVFHCAGLAQLAYAQDINQSLWDKEFEPKINGTIYLSKALKALCNQRAEKNIDIALALDSRITMINFSSMASILGGFGMAAYCSANRFQDHFSAYLNAPSLNPTDNNFQLLNINWDDWDFEYDDQQISAKAYAGIRHFSMTPDDGIKSLLRMIGNSVETDRSLLQKKPSQILVATRSVSHRIKKWLEKEPMEKTHICLSPEQANQISRITDGAIAESNDSKEGMLEDSVINIYSQVLGCDNITLDTNLFELGGDSLSASEILVALHKTSVEMQQIRIKDVLNHASPGELISFIMTMS